MLRTPLQQLCLNVKALAPGGGSIVQTLASAPTPPAAEAVQTALRELRALRALDAAPKRERVSGGTSRTCPCSTLVSGRCLFGALLGCAGSHSDDRRVDGRAARVPVPQGREGGGGRRQKAELASPGKSDHLTMAAAYAQWQKCGSSPARRAFCEKNFLSQQALEGVRASRQDYAAVLADLGFVSREYLANLRRAGVGGGAADRNANVGRVVRRRWWLAAPAGGERATPGDEVCADRGRDGGAGEPGRARAQVLLRGRRARVSAPSSVNAGAGKFESPWLVFSERVETARVYVRDSTMVGAYALLLFGGDVEVDHERGRVQMDGGWAQFNAPAGIGVLVREMRAAVDRLLERHIDACRRGRGQPVVLAGGQSRAGAPGHGGVLGGVASKPRRGARAPGVRRRARRRGSTHDSKRVIP